LVSTSTSRGGSSGPSTSSTRTTGSSVPSGTGGASWSGNPLSGVQLWANAFYASEINAYAVPTLGAKAADVGKVPTFQWIDTKAKIPLIGDALADIRAANKGGASPPYAGLFVVYDLPDRDCAALASNGEYSIANNGLNLYKGYIDEIRTLLLSYSDTRVILVIEPDSLANMVTNLEKYPKCKNAQQAYLAGTQYALQQLNLPNVAMYMDAGHAGWLGWPANLSPAAQLYAKVWSDAGKPKSLRGLVTNVANYNGWNLTSAPSYTSGNSNYDESHYVNALGPMLQNNGWTDVHFMVDTGRSGKQPTGQLEWGDWCNAIGTGFGMRPTTNTGNSLVDAFVWVKPGGECDGTSDSSAVRYDAFCGKADALKPAPEAGQWFEAYFEQLFKNANPPFN
jgi:cellulose 1,4-beta-cellobiosidase